MVLDDVFDLIGRGIPMKWCVTLITGSPSSVFVNMFPGYRVIVVCGIFSLQILREYSIRIVKTYRVSLFCPWLCLYRISASFTTLFLLYT
jgi:hypothetical protein